MAIETLLERIAVALEANTAVLEKLEAGREAALEQLQNKADTGTKAPRASRKKADETPATAGNGDNASTGSQEAAATPAADEPTISDDDIRGAAGTYIGGAGDNVENRKARAANIKRITDHFGSKTLVGETGIQDAAQRAQALFYLRRFNAGCEVDFSAEYDFAGDPAQGVEAAPVDDSMDGIG